jgi:PAS domain S-box-containing protein
VTTGTLLRIESDIVQSNPVSNVVVARPPPSIELIEERREARQQLAFANDNLDTLRLLVDSVVDCAVVMLDPKGFITTWNPGAENIKGYKSPEIIGKHFSIFHPPQAIAEDLCSRELYIATRDGHFAGEGWRLRKDGSRLWASVVITALKAPDGNLIGFGKVTSDLTERRINEEALLASNRATTEAAARLTSANAYLTNILDASIFSAIIATDLNGTITNFNRGAELMLGYTAAELVGKQTPVAFHVLQEIETRGQTLGARLGRPIRGFEVFTSSIGLNGHGQSEWTYIHKDGHPLTVNLSLSVVQTDKGQPVGYLGVAQDVTEQRRTSTELSAAYAQLNSVLKFTSDSIITIATDWTMLYGNQCAVAMLPGFAIGKNYWTCFPGVIGTPLEQTMRTAMETKVEADYEVFYEDYQQWFKGRIFPTDTGISVFFSNNTKQKQLEEELALAQVQREKRIEALSHMAGGLAHEISNPLAIIHARASDLRAAAGAGQPVPADQVSTACDSIVKTSDRAIRILRGLKGFGREAANDPMEWASVHDIVEQCFDLQIARLERHHVALELKLPLDLSLLLCRETQISQIVTNLLNNAFDAIEQSHATERWIILAATQQADTVTITVTDSGPGIEEKFRPHLMDPFFTTKAQGLGVGIGLSLSRAIAQDHGGSLTLSEGTEHTCFQLVLPINHESANS